MQVEEGEVIVMNVKQKKAARSKTKKQFELIRSEYWPEINDDDLWNRQESDGYATLPRAMPQVMAIIDALAEKGKPVSLTYLALWFRAYDLDMQLRILAPRQLAIESGFSGERAVNTWQGRMQKLAELGFIKVAQGNSGLYEYVLILNPYHVIYRKSVDFNTTSLQGLYRELKIRASEIGAKDIDEIERRVESRHNERAVQ